MALFWTLTPSEIARWPESAMSAVMDVYDEFSSALPGRIGPALERTFSIISSVGKKEFITPDLKNPAAHLLGTRGKMLRPALVFLGAHAVRQGYTKYAQIAAAVELLHVSSLIHDDIIDMGKMRRGKPSVNARYGDDAAILAGDALISRAIKLSSTYGGGVIRALSDAALQMCAGEILDYRHRSRNGVPSMHAYLRIAQLKTASIIGTSCSIAATHIGSRMERKLYNYGANLGIAFQLRDDILDAVAAGGKGTETENERTNAVMLAMSRRGTSLDSAVREVAAMNKRYIGAAIRSLDGMKADALERYALRIRINEV